MDIGLINGVISVLGVSRDMLLEVIQKDDNLNYETEKNLISILSDVRTVVKMLEEIRTEEKFKNITEIGYKEPTTMLLNNK